MLVHRSNSLEELVVRLSEVLSTPLPSLFQREVLLIQSAGMERYLSRELARRQNIIANVRFPFPRAYLREVLDLALGEERGSKGFEREALAYRIYGLLAHLRDFPASPQLHLVQKHLVDDPDGSRRFYLADQLAHLFDQYVTYRPTMVLGWENGAEATDFQAELWRRLVRHLGSVHFAARSARFLEELDDQALRSVLPPRLCLMGGPGLPPLFLQLLARLGQAIEVHVFSFSVCQEYFADAHPLDDPLPDVGEGLHPLLLSLGKVGADYQHLIEMVGNYQEGASAFVPPATRTLLGSLQRGLVEGRLSPVSHGQTSQDDSITIDSCHSRLREVEVLHDRLLHWFHLDPTLRPEDIVVLAPRIEDYSPLIDAVFSARREARAVIPYRIADRSERYTNAAARAVLLALTLFRGRFKASKVLDLLQLEPVRARYQIELTSLERLQEWVRAAGIRWGIDESHRKEFDLPEDDLNTWRFGLRRLLLGYSLADDDQQIFQATVPVDDVPVSDAELLGRFVDFCESLFALRARLSAAGPAGFTLPEWQEFLLALFDALVRESPDGSFDVEAVRAALIEVRSLRDPELNDLARDDPALVRFVGAKPASVESVRGDAELADSAWVQPALNEQPAVDGSSHDRLGLSPMLHLLTSALDASRPSTDFLTGGVTFCALLPLRTIPFRRVCLLGMNQGEFPRADSHLELDHMARSPKRGDRSLRADDRYLFLEVLLSARERLAISYVGRSVQDNTPKPPSVVLEELQTTLGLLRGDARGVSVIGHPLQPFHPSYFSTKAVVSLPVDRPQHEPGSASLPGVLPHQEAGDAAQPSTDDQVRGLESADSSTPAPSPSYDRSSYEGAKSLCLPSVPVAPFYSFDDEGRSHWETAREGVLELSLGELIRFWKDPSAAFLAEYGVYLDDELEALEDREPVEENALLRYQVGEHLLDLCARGQEPRVDVALRRGDLPVGQGGVALLRSVERVARELARRVTQHEQGARREPLAFEFTVSEALEPGVCALIERNRLQAFPSCLPQEVVLSGSVDRLYNDLRLEMSYGRLNVRRMLSLWIHHLAACAHPCGIQRSLLVARGAPDSGAAWQELSLSALSPEAARRHLAELVQLCVLGRFVPLRFFGDASYEYLQTLVRPPPRTPEHEVVRAAIAKAREVLLPQKSGVPVSTVVAELYRGEDPLGLDSIEEHKVSESPFAALAEFVFAPLLRAQEGEAQAPAALRVIRGGKR